MEDSATDDQGRTWVKVGSYTEEGFTLMELGY